ncbi:MAG: alpha/beta fold hydrolase [Deltaproteobacteria bacterium]|nr:alpha/beta fold hydrolase [Deltaproteobacteria bacterium]
MESRPKAARRAARAVGVLALAGVGAALCTALADALSITTADGRFVAVVVGVAVPLLAGYLSRPDAKRRALFGALAVPWLAALFFPRSPLAVTWLSGSALFLGAEALLYAARTTSQLATRKTSRAGLALVVAFPGLGALIAFSIVVVNLQMIIAPVRLGHQSPEVVADESEVAFESSDAYTLRGTFSPGQEGSVGAVGVVLVHGIADGRDRFVPWARRLGAAGMHSLRFDLRAHGQSDGAVCTYGQRERHDIIAAVRWMHRQPGVSNVVVVGSSMGGGAVLAASRDLAANVQMNAEVSAIVLLAPASDYALLVAKRVRLLGPFSAPVLAVSARVARAMGQTPMTGWSPRDEMTDETPVLVLHGTDDEAIPLTLSRALADDHENARLIELPGVSHDDTPDAVVNDERAWAEVLEFIGGQ